jgi:hypothetical protein
MIILKVYGFYRVKKIFKYTSVFSMWLAGLALCAHLIIPHDHHIADTFSNQEKNCPASENKSDHNSGFPMHCYAFNDLASERARSFNISQNIQVRFIALVSSQDEHLSEPQVSCARIIDFQTPFLSSDPNELNHLRAPPSQA